MRKVLRWAVVVALAGFAALGGASWFAARHLTVDRLVAEAEKEINSRVQIGSMEVSLFQVPARIVLRDVILAPRDGQEAKPYPERAPLAGGPVEVKEVRLAVSLAQLLARRIDIREFAFEEPRLGIVLDEEGNNSLDELLRSPGGGKSGKSGVPAAPPGGGGESLNVYQQGFLARIDGVRSTGGEVDLEIAKTRLRLLLHDVDVRLDAIEVDPAALAETNAARLSLAGRLEVRSTKRDLLYGRLDFDGPARVKLFNPATGDLDPEVSADLALGEESYLNAEIPVVRKAWKAVQLLEKLGVKVDDLPPRADFGRSRSLAVHYFADRFTLEKPISLWFDDWELAVVDGTWIQTESDQHAGSAELVASERLSNGFRSKIGEGLSYLPKEIYPEVLGMVEGELLRDGRLVVEIASAGDLSDPDVSALNMVPDVGDLVKAAAGRVSGGQLEELAEGLLKKLLGGD
ncbi:MAG: hypothetical protein HKN82_09285 [Akkermansiaceae bacterium]|nr:hypothetical protein [Akkermansiaceae bacterium]